MVKATAAAVEAPAAANPPTCSRSVILRSVVSTCQLTITNGANGPASIAKIPVTGKEAAATLAVAVKAVCSLISLLFNSANSLRAVTSLPLSCCSLSFAQPPSEPVKSASLVLMLLKACMNPWETSEMDSDF